ncbi:hypothetical protein GCM10020256_21580 [Streptomyces thermocoprophilus]
MQPVREAIGDQLARFTEEVRAELAKDPVSAGWSDEDLMMLAHLYVDQMLSTASLFLETPAEDGEERARVADLARRQLRLISLGRRHWNAE